MGGGGGAAARPPAAAWAGGDLACLGPAATTNWEADSGGCGGGGRPAGDHVGVGSSGGATRQAGGGWKAARRGSGHVSFPQGLSALNDWAAQRGLGGRKAPSRQPRWCRGVRRGAPRRRWRMGSRVGGRLWRGLHRACLLPPLTNRGAILRVLAAGWERRERPAGKKESPVLAERGRHACPRAGTRGRILAPPPSDSVYDGFRQCVEGCLHTGNAPVSRCDRRSSGGAARDTHEVASVGTIVERIGLFRLHLMHTIAVDREIEGNVSPLIAYLSSRRAHDRAGFATLALLLPTGCDHRL